MESKDKMNLETQNELENSEIKTELDNEKKADESIQNELVEEAKTELEKTTVDPEPEKVEEVVAEVEESTKSETVIDVSETENVKVEEVEVEASVEEEINEKKTAEVEDVSAEVAADVAEEEKVVDPEPEKVEEVVVEVEETTNSDTVNEVLETENVKVEEVEAKASVEEEINEKKTAEVEDAPAEVAADVAEEEKVVDPEPEKVEEVVVEVEETTNRETVNEVPETENVKIEEVEAETSADEVGEKKTTEVEDAPTELAADVAEEEITSNVLADEVTQEPKEVKPKVPELDYSTLSQVELVNAFTELLENKSFMDIYSKVDIIKVNFYKKSKVLIQEQKKAFIEGGGIEEEFKPESNPYEPDLKKLLDEFRQRKASHNKEIENEKDQNVKIKYEIIEEIKTLVNRKESINKTFQDFKELQQKWRDVGLVPQASMKDLWENYHHHVENFYDYIKINKELRDLDLKKNQEEKIGLCEKAEELLLEPSVIKAFNTLQKLHETWREVGPVPRDKKDELWERFKDATTKINKKHQEFFENRKKSQKKNLEAKTALCEKVEEILAVELSSHKDWEDKSSELVELQKYWRTIGFTPKKENNAIYERFRNACDNFFDKKREFYSKHKEVQSNNLQMKIDLCVQAEALKESTDWKKTTDEYISIQKKWKEIGPIPRKHSDSIWKRFRSACDFFFESKSKYFNTKDETQVENLKLKNDLIIEVEEFKPSGNDEGDFEKLRDFQSRWTEVGHVPIADKNDVQKRFRDAINLQFDKFSIEDKERNLMKFKSKMSDWKTSPRGHNKMYAERDKYVSKLKQLESDLITLQNNIGFFANSKGAESLIKDVEQKITNNEEQIAYLKEKIRVIDDVDYNEQ